MPNPLLHKVRINPDKTVNGQPLTVLHPDTRSPFPARVFDMTDADWRNPRIRRLFPRAGLPGGAPGGVFGDLVQVQADPSAEGSKAAKSTKTAAPVSAA